MPLNIADKTFTNRLLLGTALYPAPEIMQQAIGAAGCEIITVSLKRQNPQAREGQAFWQLIKDLGCTLLPNTAGCRSAREAITTAQMARELFATNWIKLEVTGDDYNLQPDPFELLIAAKELLAQDFVVLPYCTDDLVLCQRLADCGCQAVMPWASPIGCGKGILNSFALTTIRQRLKDVTLIVDAGIGAPSHAALAMELGFDGVLLNSAVALAQDPIKMATAFNQAITAGRQAYEAGLMPERDTANPSTPLIDTPFWVGTEENS